MEHLERHLLSGRERVSDRTKSFEKSEPKKESGPDSLTIEQDGATKRQREIQRLRRLIVVKEKLGLDTTPEKVALIETQYGLGYSKEEKNGFDKWLEKMPENSLAKPLRITSVKEIFGFLPKYANYKNEKINLFFSKEYFTPEELLAILENFSMSDPAFEISVVKHGDNLISIGIGGKTRNSSTLLFEGAEEMGHSHPQLFESENTEEALPECFMKRLMPSPGDVQGFLKHADSIKNGTSIFSKSGHVFIKLLPEVINLDDGVIAEGLRDFRDKYFDLFLGANRFGFSSDEDVAAYFGEKFGLDIQFFYNLT